MNTERIRELAEQAKAESNQWLGSKPAITVTHDELEKFAELIAAEEREACAKVCEQVGQHKNQHGIAAAIRARGNE